VFAGVGERTREGNDLYKEMIESVRCLRSLMRRLRQLWATPVSRAQHPVAGRRTRGPEPRARARRA